jgi:hypothetical protein
VSEHPAIVYRLIRSAYRWSDRAVVQRLPASWRERVQALLFGLARHVFPARISARSPREFAAGSAGGQPTRGPLPEWARAEVRALAALEPQLAALGGDAAALEHYVIPWDMRYVGQRYAVARRQLRAGYACMLFMGGDVDTLSVESLAACARPLAIVDVDDAPATAQRARAIGADYVALPPGDLDLSDHCAVLARLALQCAPRQLLHVAHPVLDACVQRHGLALASVAAVAPWPTGASQDTVAP